MVGIVLASLPSPRLALFAFLSATSLYFLWKSRRCRLQPSASSLKPTNPSPRGKILYASATGTSRSLAGRLSARLRSHGLPFDLVDPRRYEPEDLPKENVVLIVASTWEDGRPPHDAQFLSRWLAESAADFRVGSLLLARCRFAVFGVGSRSYGDSFNAAAKDFSKWMRALGASEMAPLWEGDMDSGDVDDVFELWCRKIVGLLKGDSVAEDGHFDSMAESNGLEVSDEDFDEETEVEDLESAVVDMEDIAGKAPSRKLAVALTNGRENGVRDMVTPVIRTNLEKQGYKIIGSHSGVKLCRWTKSQLRGRGGCYKHSFYGIESHRCMEATPSLACANKCVFCWRHHTNPVGKSWQWKMDNPLEIVDAVVSEHTKMIKQMKGVPGVKTERLSEGLSPRHCALSLVGEPIMYPEINALVDELHRRHISTFLVTNAQFPDRIMMLKPITQLYVSVDAATKDSLKAIDRPLFGDFWERFLDSLKALRDKEQRTVYRLTLVKGWNAEDLDAYANLLSVGKPDLIEIKGVTYCGSSATSKLTMDNVPWHSDVKAFSEALASKSSGEYEVACEHAHSCCVLLAKVDRFKINGEWHTWIDYERFHELVVSGKPFRTEDYMARTPSWAIYGAEEGGFDPYQSRYKKERRHGTASLRN
ncbi:S-adenosyl-L-methionine-dependent tRNA 4-demethylwyosine synthase-like [Zingiber officinale]|uniref:S-adenosyl-L-methionine-dependent tRNA 4-demethylwyosine synthase-like n=1 Tax=Zingiber officinale TaxID=94328 RepID=UPI001C4AABA1|nr:S-adenosyl-L-methionine-dependent tRNA 4-demethylwyosine synthase-like [Zingiber officinale]